jgi:hypothetical protein
MRTLGSEFSTTSSIHPYTETDVSSQPLPGMEEVEPETIMHESDVALSDTSSNTWTTSFPRLDGCSICTFAPYQASGGNSVVQSRSQPGRKVALCYRAASTQATVARQLPVANTVPHKTEETPVMRRKLDRERETAVVLHQEPREAGLGRVLKRLGTELNGGPTTALQATVESVADDSDDTGGVDV